MNKIDEFVFQYQSSFPFVNKTNIKIDFPLLILRLSCQIEIKKNIKKSQLIYT